VAAYDIKALKSKAVQYAVVLPGIPQKSASQFYEELKESAALVKTFSPYVDESLSPSDNVTMTGGPFTWSEIVRRRGNGHALQIYRLTAEVL